MTTNDDILAALQRDVAAAASKPSAHEHGNMAQELFCDECQERHRARARIAALDGPALLEALMGLLADERFVYGTAHRAVAVAGKVLGL